MIERQLEGDYRRRAIKLLMNLNALALMGPPTLLVLIGGRELGILTYFYLLGIPLVVLGTGYSLIWEPRHQYLATICYLLKIKYEAKNDRKYINALDNVFKRGDEPIPSIPVNKKNLGPVSKWLYEIDMMRLYMSS